MHAGRPAELTIFLDALKSGLAQVETGEPSAMLERVFAKLDHNAPLRKEGPESLPVCEHLGAVLAELDQPGHALAALARSLRAIAPKLRWSERPGPAPGANDLYRGGHANAMIIGPGGIEQRRDLWIGISLLAPGVRYPDHDHAPPELYLVLTPGRFMHGNDDWVSPGTGGNFYNSPGIMHAMAAEDGQPLAALWVLDVA